MPVAEDDRPPVERSARRPPTGTSRPTSSSDEIFAKHRKPNRDRFVDPRFDSMFGKADKAHFSQNYKFLMEQRATEQQARLKRIRQINTVLRRLRIEEALDEEGGDAEALDEYNFTDEEEDVFINSLDPETTTQADVAMARRDLAMLRRTPIEMLAADLDKMKREVALFKSQTGDAKSKNKADDVKKRIIKEEVKAVKDGSKKRVFFPKRSDLKRRVAERTFDELEGAGGKNLVDKYLEKKRKR